MTLYVSNNCLLQRCGFFPCECVTKTLNTFQLHYDSLSIHIRTQKLNFYKNIILIIRI